MMRIVGVSITVFLSCISQSLSFKVPSKLSIYSSKSSATSNSALYDAAEGRDLTGHSMWIKFTGLGVENMNFGIELNDKFQAIYSRGLESAYPGFWRVIKYDDGRETVEVTQPVLPEYMLFFDLWEPTLIWRGKLDIANNKVVDGEVITNKKRFGLFPYTETLATFTAELLVPGRKLPTVDLPKFSEQRFAPPDDFDSPFDMKRYPQYFDPEFVDYFFEQEDAIVKGTALPARPKAFFVPDKNKRMTETGEIIEAEVEVSGKNLKERSKSSGSDSKSFGKKK